MKHARLLKEVSNLRIMGSLLLILVSISEIIIGSPTIIRTAFPLYNHLLSVLLPSISLCLTHLPPFTLSWPPPLRRWPSLAFGLCLSEVRKSLSFFPAFLHPFPMHTFFDFATLKCSSWPFQYSQFQERNSIYRQS
jgi:hypothetical protein